MMVKFKILGTILWAFLFLGFFPKAYGSSSLISTGSKMIESGTYKLGVEFQTLTDRPTGINFLGFVDLPFPHPSMDYRIKVGVGKISSVGGLLKWVPIPDLLTQPALGGIFDIEWTNKDHLNTLNFRVAPLISKNFSWEHGSMTPYGAFPIGLKLILDDIEEDEIQSFIQMNLGLELSFNNLEGVYFIAESGFSIKDLRTYFSVSASVKIP